MRLVFQHCIRRRIGRKENFLAWEHSDKSTYATTLTQVENWPSNKSMCIVGTSLPRRFVLWNYSMSDFGSRYEISVQYTSCQNSSCSLGHYIMKIVWNPQCLFPLNFFIPCLFLSIPCLFTMFTTVYSLFIPLFIPIFCMYIPCLFLVYSLSILCLFPVYSLSIPYLSPVYSLYIPCLFFLKSFYIQFSNNSSFSTYLSNEKLFPSVPCISHQQHFITKSIPFSTLVPRWQKYSAVFISVLQIYTEPSISFIFPVFFTMLQSRSKSCLNAFKSMVWI